MAGVRVQTIGTSPTTKIAHLVYVDADDLYYAEYDLDNLSFLTNPYIIEDGSVSGVSAYVGMPRIDAYNVEPASIQHPLRWQAAVEIDFGTSTNYVRFYDNTGSAGTETECPILNSTCDVDYNLYQGFSPAVSAGSGDSYPGPQWFGGTFIQAGYLSDNRRTTSSPSNPYSKYWAFQHDIGHTSIDGPYEINSIALNVKTTPIFASSVSTNFGITIGSAWYTTNHSGPAISWKFNGNPPGAIAYKPGRPASVKDITSDELNIFPNPANEILNINNAKDMKYAISDISGRIVLQGSVDSELHQISTTQLMNGTYIINLSSEQEQKNLMFVKNK